MITLIDGDLYQWDTGRIVLVEPDNGYIIHEVHFTTKKMEFAYVVKTYSKGQAVYASIPNILLQQYQDIICYEVRENDAGEESVSRTSFDVIKRNRPEDYVYTESEKYTYKELEERLSNLETEFEDLKASVDEASVLSNNAYEIAESAKSAVENIDVNITLAKQEAIDTSKTYTNEQIAAATESLVKSPTTAEAGQLLSVKTVDENNAPTEWETVDYPVESVNGKTGAVKLTASDVGAAGAVQSVVLSTNESIYNAVKDMYWNGRPQIILYYIPGYSTTDKFTFFFPSDFVDGTGYKQYLGIAVRHPDGDVYKYNSMVDWGAYKLVLTKLTAETLPNPEKLTFSGAASAEYDGSEAVEIEFDSGVKSVNGLEPDEDGVVEITPQDIGAQPEDYYVRFTEGEGKTLVSTATGYAQTLEAYNAGQTIRGILGSRELTLLSYGEETGFVFIANDPDNAGSYETYTLQEGNTVAVATHSRTGSFPTPNALTFTGAVEATYDGSEPVTVDISVDSEHTHDDRYYTEDEVDSKISAIESSVEEANEAIEEVSSLVGDTAVSTQISNAVSQKTAVQIVVWEDDD